jgi:hypothetical protein
MGYEKRRASETEYERVNARELHSLMASEMASQNEKV